MSGEGPKHRKMSPVNATKSHCFNLYSFLVLLSEKKRM